MDIKYRSHTFQVAECDLIVMGDNFYAKVNIGQRGNDAWHYIKVTPPVREVIDPRIADNIIALTEILNTRNPERQASRDLYTDNLYWEIEMAVAA